MAELYQILKESADPSGPPPLRAKYIIKLEGILAQESHFFRNPVVVGLALVFSVLHLALTRARALHRYLRSPWAIRCFFD